MEIFDMMCRSLTRDKFHDRSPNKGTELFHDKPEYEWALVREEIGTEEEDPIAEMYYLLHETAACVQTKMIAVQNSAVLARILDLSRRRHLRTLPAANIKDYLCNISKKY